VLAITNSKENRVRLSRTSLLRITAAATALALAGTLSACSGVQNGAASGGSGDEYPSGPVEIVVGSSAGGSTDLLARKMAEVLEGPLGETVTVLDQPGANGAVAAGELMNRPPDGQRLMLTSGSLMTITPHFVSAEEALSVDDLQLVTGVGREDYVLVANASSGITSIADIAGAGRPITYATAGVGTGGQLSQRLLFDKLGVQGTDVPFEGGAPAVTALLGSQVDVASVQVLEAMPHIKSGAFVPIATFGAARSPFLPDTPTATEQGNAVVVDQTRFVWVPMGTPETTVTTLAEAFRAVFADSSYQEFISQNYIAPDETDAATTARNLESDRQRYKAAMTAAGITP
jgi:tripartite-type tricarboxylate transporter receptor subunit TctC